MQRMQLSKADTKVLAQVFDPESAPSRAEVLVDPGLPQDRHVADSQILTELRAKEAEAISIIEQYEKSQQTSSAKGKAYAAALEILDSIVRDHPDFASARNNRAQLRRWWFGDRHLLCQAKTDADEAKRDAGIATVSDLETAIRFASPEKPNDAVSPRQGRLLAQAYTQLAALYYAAFKDLDSPSIVGIVAPGFEGWNRNRFEDEASRLFYLGGLYGNEVAKALAVHTNPHAKLCGSIVKEAMRKEMAGMLS